MPVCAISDVIIEHPENPAKICTCQICCDELKHMSCVKYLHLDEIIKV